MSYDKQNFVSGQTLKSEHLNNIEEGIIANENAINTKQDELVSGSNIKTINGKSILGEGDINTGSQCINNAVFFGDSITHGVYSYFNADGNRENGFDTTDEGHPRIPACFGELANANVTNNGKRGSGWVQDTRKLGNGLVMTRQTNFANYDFAAYCLGINDWIQGAPLGTFSDTPSQPAASMFMRTMSMRSVSNVDTNTTIDVVVDGEPGVPIETTLSQGYASNATIDDKLATRVKTGFIQPPYYIEVNSGYRIRAIMGYKTNDGVTTPYKIIKGTSTTATSYTIGEDPEGYNYHIITFADATDPSKNNISPTANIVKELRTPGTETNRYYVTGGVVAGTEPISTELVNGAASVYTDAERYYHPRILEYNGFKNRVRTEFIQPPYHIETNDGFVIRGIMGYTDDDYVSGTGAYIIDSAITNGTSYTIDATKGYPYKYHMITFTKTDPTANINPGEEIIKKFYVPAEDESDLVTTTAINAQQETILGGEPIETTLSQGFASNPINHTATNRVKTYYIKPPYRIEVNEGYVIRAIYGYASEDENDITGHTVVRNTSTTATVYEVRENLGHLHRITFAKANPNDNISPDEDIIKSLTTVETEIYTASIVGGTVNGTTAIATELVNGAATYSTNVDGVIKKDILRYDGDPNRVRTEFIQAPFHVETYSGYVIRTITAYNNDDYVNGTAKQIQGTSTTRTSYTVTDVDDEYTVYMLTFAKVDPNEEIRPGEKIVKKLYTPALDITVSDPVSFTGSVEEGAEGIGIYTSLSQGFASNIFNDTLTTRAKTNYIQPPYKVKAGEGYVIRSIYAYPTNDGDPTNYVEIRGLSTSLTTYEVSDESNMYHVITFAKVNNSEEITIDEDIVEYLYIPLNGDDNEGEGEGGDSGEGEDQIVIVDFTGEAKEGYEPISTQLMNGAGSARNGLPEITRYDGMLNRMRTEYIRAPFYVETKPGYIIRAVGKYSTNDYVNGSGILIKSAGDIGIESFELTDTDNYYYMITFTNADSSLNISPTEDVIKYLCKPTNVNDGEDNTGDDNKEEIIYGENVDIVGAVKGIETTLTRGYGSTTINDTQTNRVKTGFIQPPYYIEVNEGYVIRAIYSYNNNDGSTTGVRNIKATSETATSYKITDTTGYHIITFAKADNPNEEIMPNTGIVKYLYSLSTNDGGSSSGNTIENLKGKYPVIVEGTVIGNMCLCLQQIAEQNPLCKIVVYSPYNTWGQVSVGGDYTSNTRYGDESTNYALGVTNKAGYTLQDLIDVIDKVCKYYGIAHVPLSQSNICNRLTIKNIMIDGLHPSRESRPYLAAEIFGKKGFDC
jgi:hypothetical protein